MHSESYKVTGVSNFSLVIDRSAFLESVTCSYLGYGPCLERQKGIGERDIKNEGLPFSSIGGREGKVQIVGHYFQWSLHPAAVLMKYARHRMTAADTQSTDDLHKCHTSH